MITPVEDKHPHTNAEHPRNQEKVDEDFFGAVSDEVKEEVSHIQHSIHHFEEPIDAKQSDVLIRKHFNGMVITLFVVVAVLLAVGMYAITIFGHHVK